MDWKKLQNGSDIRGVALEGVEGENVNLTTDVAHTLGMAFVAWLKKKNGDEQPAVAIGTDSRLSGPDLKKAFASGVAAAGSDVYDCALATTPAMFAATIDKDLPTTAAVMVTASHLPFNRNGLKFFTPEGGLNKGDIADILTIAETEELKPAGKRGKMHKHNYMKTYAQGLVSYIREGAKADTDEPLKGMHIVVDAGNGCGGFFVDVLKKLGADTDGSQFLEPDGHFPNHIPNPENKEAMASVCDAVRKNNADLGIIFDTDVDRSAIVDDKGDPINRNALIALIGAIVLKEHPGSTIVTDSVTSDGLTTFINERGGRHHRFKRGYKNVINEAIRLNKAGDGCWLAIETSGHAALRENHFLDDGAFLVAKLLVWAARLKTKDLRLQDIIKDLQQPAESAERRFRIVEDDYKQYGRDVLLSVPDKVRMQDDWEIVSPNYEGVRVHCNAPEEDGWFLLRMSLHDPVMPLNIESNVKGGVAHIEERLMKILEKYEGLK